MQDLAPRTTSLTARVLQQIAKDIELINSERSGVEQVTWIFARSAANGNVGPTGPLRQALEMAGIKIVVR
jgi:hypothetical protein